MTFTTSTTSDRTSAALRARLRVERGPASGRRAGRLTTGAKERGTVLA